MTGKDNKTLRLRKSKKEKTAKDEQQTEFDTEAPWEIDRLAMFLFVAVPLLISCLIGYFYYQEMMRNLIAKPSGSPLVITEERYKNMSRFWGTYRPGVYFGTKTRSANSPVSGMMWFEQNLPHQPKIRHLCEQGDKLPKYGWLKHNGNDFGIHQVVDNGFTITTEYIKRAESRHGGDWSARIKAFALDDSKKPKTVSILYYFATDGLSKVNPDIRGHDHLTALHGSDSELGDFKLSFKAKGSDLMYNNMVTHTPGYEHIDKVLSFGLAVKHSPEGEYVGLKGRLVPVDSPGPNMFVYQVTGQLPLTLEVVYEASSFSGRPNSLEGSVLNTEILARVKQFDNKFESIFKLKEKGFSDKKIEFAQAALSNMIGGIGYFFGSSIVQSVYNQEPIKYWEAPLFTAVPSRSFFPRGFLWDEGFHNLLIKEWDQDLSLDIIGYWMDLMNTEGWIPREQILDGEARAKVPAEFVVQRNQNANPPTFFLPLESIIQNLIEENSTAAMSYMARLYPRLQTWYNWFNKTQAGKTPYTFRWRGRNPEAVREINPKTLTSGLDDYPRASHPTEDERHLDLRCWMAVASKVMARISKSLGQPWEAYQSFYEVLSDNQLLNELHWSESSQRYADYGLHTDGTTLKRPPAPANLQPGQPIPHRDLERVVTKDPVLSLVTSHLGYVSLFPLITHIVDPQSFQLGQILKALRDEKLLWTNYGIRSLSRSSPLYHKHNTEHDPPYWRGAIWININFLTVRSLKLYSQIDGPHKSEASKLYEQLRSNLIENLYNEYLRTGYLWEQYDDKTGQGKGCHPFTGWSALITLIMAEKY